MNARRSFVLSTSTAILMGLLLSPPCLRAENADHGSRSREQSTHEQRARELIERLDLSRLQARKCMSIAEQAALLYIEGYEQEARLLPEILEAYDKFAQEDRLNQGFSPDVEQRTARLHRREIVLRERITEQLIALEEQAGKVLKSSQRESLNNFSQKQRPVRERTRRTDARSRARAARRQREEARTKPLREAREQLRTLHKQIHPRIGPIGQYLLHPFGAERLRDVARARMPAILTEAADVLKHGTSDHPVGQVEQQKAEIKQLRAEISNWNLINGLHLNENQIEQITALYDEAAAPTWEIARRESRSGLPYRTLAALERDVEQVLNTGQHQVLAEYKPCLLPPKNLKDPVRAGQAGDSSRYEKWLDRARKLSSQELKKQIDRALEKEAKHLGQLSRTERRERVALLRKTIRQASTMSDTEFELSKAELAELIAAPDRTLEMRGKVDTLARKYGQPGIITNFMLNTQFMDQLRTRGQQLAGGIATKQTDLATGPQADNCDEVCAIDGKCKKKSKKE